MSNQQNLAFEYALGLLTQAEKAGIQQTPEFVSAVEKIQLQLSALHLQAPLEKAQSEQIWRNIQPHLQTHQTHWKATWVNRFRLWLYVLPALFLGLGSWVLFEQSTQVSTPYSSLIINAKSGWEVNADLDKRKLLIAAINPIRVGKNEICVLWVRKNGNTHFISTLPNSGDKILNLQPKIAQMLKNGEAIISIEATHKPMNQPTRIEYRRQLS